MTLPFISAEELEQFIPPVDTAKVVFSIIICVLGLLANVAAISFILILKEYKKSVTHWYVLQLAIADSLFLLTLPFKVSEDLQRGWVYYEWMCKAKETILFLNYYASVLFLVVMSIDRYIAVCHIFSSTIQKLRTKTSAYIITFCVWSIALLLCIPVMMFSYKIGVAPHCECSYVFPKPPENSTAICLEQLPNDPLEIDLVLCIEARNIPQIDNGEPYCKEYASIGGSGIELPPIFFSGAFDGNFSFPSSGEGSGDMDTSSNTTMNETTTVTALTDIVDETPLKLPENNLRNSMPTIADACHYWDHPLSWKIFLGFNFVVMFVFPVVILVVCYGLLIRRFSRVTIRSASMKSTQKNKPATGIKDRKRVTIMCASLVSCFILCWLPFHAVHFAKFVGINAEVDFCVSIVKAVGLLAYVNSALNPYLYSFLGTNLSKKWNLLKQSPGMLQLTNWKQTGRTSVGRSKTSRKGTGPSRSNQPTSMKQQYPPTKANRPNHTSDSSQVSPSIQTGELTTDKHQTQEFLDHSSYPRFTQNSFDDKLSSKE